MANASRLARRLFALLWVAVSLQASGAPEISSFAFVHEDGTLTVSGQRIHLYGIYIPPTDRTCSTFIQPMPCGTRASLALEFRISGDFVRCSERNRSTDGTIIASCSANGEDLSEWMLQRGWAVALPDAPFAYAAMEKIARAKGLGIWGIPVDAVRPAR